MKKVEFKATLLSGHKGVVAAEFPHDPEKLWSIPPRKLWPGRNGHHVEVKLNGIVAHSCIVPRMKRFFVIIDDDLQKEAKVSAGDIVSLVVAPLASPENEAKSAKSQSGGKKKV